MPENGLHTRPKMDYSSRSASPSGGAGDRTMVDWTKPVRTRDGRRVRVLCRDARNAYPIVALIEDGKCERVDRYCADGSWLENQVGPTGSDLVNAPERVTYYVNWYAPAGSALTVNTSREVADACASSSSRRSTALLSILTEDGVPVAVEIERVAT